MSKLAVGELYDKAFETMTQQERIDNLEAIAWGLEERSYTKNLSPEEIVERKDEYAQIALKLDEIAVRKKEILEQLKQQEKQPKLEAKELLSAIKFKSEQKYGKLFLVDDQEKKLMYSFDVTGVCVDVRPLTKEEQQLKLKKVINE
jgi:enoyl-CoA hydratase/carnithine racemase